MGIFGTICSGIWGLGVFGNGCGLQINGFSARTEPYGSIFDDVDDFDNSGISVV